MSIRLDATHLLYYDPGRYLNNFIPKIKLINEKIKNEVYSRGSDFLSETVTYIFFFDIHEYKYIEEKENVTSERLVYDDES